MKTYSAKAADIENRWVIIDAEGVVLGRLASIIALRLRGKHKPIYTPHVDCGDSIIVVNAAKIVLTGDKSKSKTYHYHTGYVGGLKARTAAEMLRGKYPERILMKAVERMLPRGPLGRRQFAKLRAYPGPEHPHEAQQPELLDVKALNQKNTVSLRSNRVPGGPRVVNPAAGSDVKRLFLIERALMELDHSEEDRRANALDRLADALCRISSEGPADEWPMRKILRDVPDRLLLALMENAQARNAGRAAAKALVYCLYPDKYRDEPVKTVSEKKVHDDLMRALQARHINSFTSLQIDNAGANGATVMVQLSLGLGFPLDGRKLRLEAPTWLDVDRGIDIVVSGAVVRDQRPLAALREGVVAGCVAEVRPGKDSKAVSIYLRSGEKMFDQFVIDRDQLFPASPRSIQKPPSWKHTASLAGRPHALS